MTDVSVGALSKCLIDTKSLISFNLEGNKISDNGVFSLMNVFSNQLGIKEINLSTWY